MKDIVGDLIKKSRGKLDVEGFRRTGVDHDIKNAKTRWRELIADLRYLGNSGYPRLKDGKEWGEWDMDTLLRYYAKIVDTLRGLYFPIMPQKDDNSYWQCYRDADKYMETKPPATEEEAREWDDRRREIVKRKITAASDLVADAIITKQLNIPGIYPDALAKLKDEFLIKLHDDLHAYWADRWEKISKEDVVNAHSFILEEYAKRKIDHPYINTLDDQAKPKAIIDKAPPEEGEAGGRDNFDVKAGDKGSFVLQEHEMGLEEESARSKTPRENLPDKGQVHSDIRIKIAGRDYLVGFTIAIGNLKDDNKLIAMKPGERALVPSFKLRQPPEWYDAGKDKYTVIAPGEAGSHAQTWARMHRIDTGDVTIGTADDHYIEFWFDGDKLKGRYILTYVPVGDGERKWMISKPEEQRMDSELEEEKGGGNMDWKDALSLFENEQELNAFVDKATKALTEQDLANLKIALAALGRIENLSPEAKKAIKDLAAMAGSANGDMEKYDKSLQEIAKKVDEIAKVQETINGIVTKIAEIEKKMTPPASTPTADPFGDAMRNKKK